MIVRNEEKNLPRCLASVTGIFDQIIIVDTGSTDKTCEIAKSFGAEVHHFDWIDDFSAARNFSFSLCTCDYIMWLDADDEILPDSKAKLQTLKENLDKANVFMAPYHYAMTEDGKPWVVLYRERILKNSKEARWRWPIHECINYPLNWPQLMIDVVVTHRRSADDITLDRGRNLRLLRKAYEENKTDPRLQFYYAKELFSEGLLKEAIETFELYFAVGGGWHDDQVNGRYLLAMAHLQLGDQEKAINQAMAGIKQDPRWAEFYIIIGQIYYDRAQWHQAIPWFELAAKIPIPQTLGTIVTENYTWVPSDRLCKCYSEVGRIHDSYEAAKKALAHRPFDPRLQFNVEFLKDQLFPGRKFDRPIRLSLGSGGKPTHSYRSTDLYPNAGVEELIDQHSVPYHSGTVHAIYSEHALEHSGGHIQAEQAISEWARVLRHGGHLTLKVPDLDECCRLFIKAEDRACAPGERWTEKDWYRYTIYGIQIGQNGEPDEGQYHRTGFTAPQLRRLLENNGFEVRNINHYDGYGTPSLHVEAIQVRQPIKVAWLLPSGADETNGSMRIRRLNVHRWLVSKGVDSRLIDLNQDQSVLITQLSGADVCVFISHGAKEHNLLGELKRRGIKCIMDHCEDLEGFPFQTECFEAVDMVACCSRVLADKSRKYGRTVVLPDACED